MATRRRTESARRALPRSEPRLSALVDEWLDHKRSVGGVSSEHTEAAYRRDLAQWAWRIADLLGKPDVKGADTDRSAPAGPQELTRLSPADLDAEVVEAILASMARDGYAPASRARMLAALKGFCGFLVRRGHLLDDPTEDLRLKRHSEQLPKAFSDSDLRRLVEAVSKTDPAARAPWPARDRAALAILAGTGVRASEACALKVTDVVSDADEGPVLRVRGKGKRQRTIPLSAEVLQAIDTYLEDRGARLGPYKRGDPLLVTAKGRPLTRAALNYHIDRWCARAGVARPEGEVAHAFRHTYAKRLVARGVALPVVQQLLGHKDLKTTSVYLRMTAVEVAEGAAAAAVRDHLRAVPAPPPGDHLQAPAEPQPPLQPAPTESARGSRPRRAATETGEDGTVILETRPLWDDRVVCLAKFKGSDRRLSYATFWRRPQGQKPYDIETFESLEAARANFMLRR